MHLNDNGNFASCAENWRCPGNGNKQFDIRRKAVVVVFAFSPFLFRPCPPPPPLFLRSPHSLHSHNFRPDPIKHHEIRAQLTIPSAFATFTMQQRWRAKIVFTTKLHIAKPNICKIIHSMPVACIVDDATLVGAQSAQSENGGGGNKQPEPIDAMEKCPA